MFNFPRVSRLFEGAPFREVELTFPFEGCCFAARLGRLLAEPLEQVVNLGVCQDRNS